MHLLISTARFLLGRNTETQQTDVLHSEMDEYYGISWDPAGQRLALSHSMIDNATLADLASYAVSEVGVLSFGHDQSRPFLSQPHQILWVGDDHLVATNTGRNTVSSLRVSDQSMIERRIGTAVWDRLSASSADGVHLNSLYFADNTLYVVAHNFDKGSFVTELEWPTLKERGRWPIPGLSGVHNLYRDASGTWVTCDSMNGALADARTGRTLWTNGMQGYTHGLAATADVVFVGHSEQSGRALRTRTESGVWVVDPKTWTTVDYIYLGHFGCVNEVRITDQPDLAHHGALLGQQARVPTVATARPTPGERVQQAKATLNLARTWKPIIGAIKATPDAAIASDGSLILSTMITGEGKASGIEAVFQLRPGESAGCHASLIARYHGPDDQNMIAVLFQDSGRGEVIGSLWTQSDNAWRQHIDRPLDVEQMSMSGTAHCFKVALWISADDIFVEVGDQPFLQFSSAEEQLPLENGVFGVRLYGTRFALTDIRPLTAQPMGTLTTALEQMHGARVPKECTEAKRGSVGIVTR